MKIKYYFNYIMLRSPIYIDVSEHDHLIPTTTHKSLLIPPTRSTALTLSVLQSIFHPEPATLDLEFVKKCLSIPQRMDEYIVVQNEPSPTMHQQSLTVYSSNSRVSSSNPYKITIPKHLQMTRHTKNLPVYLQLEVPVLSRVKSINTISSPLNTISSQLITPITGPVIPLTRTNRPIVNSVTSRPITPTSDSIKLILPETHSPIVSCSNLISKPPLKKTQSKPWK